MNYLRGAKHNYVQDLDIKELIQKIRNTHRYDIQWRCKVYDRDGWKCVLCGSEEIDAHHKRSLRSILIGNSVTTVEEAQSVDEIWDIDNGMTLCKRCHGKLKWNRVTPKYLLHARRSSAKINKEG